MSSEKTPWPGADETRLPTWDQRILALVPSSVDFTQVAEDLTLSATQRLEKLQALVEAAEQLRARAR